MACIPLHAGTATPHALELVETTRAALAAAISICGPNVPFAQIGHVIHSIADQAGLSVVRDLVGHGIGRRFHAAPSVLHHRNNRPGVMVPGQTFTIEPILTLGSREHRMWEDGWTLVTVDGSLAAQFEHTLLVTEVGVEVVTEVGEVERVKAQEDVETGEAVETTIASKQAAAAAAGGLAARAAAAADVQQTSAAAAAR